MDLSRTYRTTSPEETERLGSELASELKAGDCVALTGELGGGKTRFVRGIARGLSSKGFVKSPSFTIMNIYEGGSLPLYHIDLYRLASTEELEAAGLEEYILGDGVSVIEWAERSPSLLKSCRITVSFRYISDTEREIEVVIKGAGK
ncbi:MAG: tRNA (adenosine(37)-N6)-threonylcarbamoyltransferase complex ATPase subunit type 1 TsaE [Deltaproteobacteria bacterium GWA2_55_10]|nr:MAG: tRNA (adenosine(37)-N6)-threonylcarbamoyltransferase complex ATPase subunit type 1 TsaE [Deltaproteobacteria bacterium GWA2_55_10]